MREDKMIRVKMVLDCIVHGQSGVDEVDYGEGWFV